MVLATSFAVKSYPNASFESLIWPVSKATSWHVYVIDAALVPVSPLLDTIDRVGCVLL